MEDLSQSAVYLMRWQVGLQPGHASITCDDSYPRNLYDPGCFIDALAMVLLTVPIFYPIVVDVLGYSPIWFGVIIVMVVAMG